MSMEERIKELAKEWKHLEDKDKIADKIRMILFFDHNQHVPLGHIKENM